MSTHGVSTAAPRLRRNVRRRTRWIRRHALVGGGAAAIVAFGFVVADSNADSSERDRGTGSVRVEHRQGDSQILDREAGGVEQGDLLITASSGGAAK